MPPAGGATANAPKRWVAADVDAFVDAFVDAYLELGPEARHAYELLEATRGCHLFFDLDGRSDGKFNCEEVAILAPHCPPIGHEHISIVNPNSEFKSQRPK